MADNLVTNGCPAYSTFFGFSGVTFAIVFSGMINLFFFQMN